VLRVRRPELHRPFKTPLVPLVPILGIVVSLGLMAGLPGEAWLRLFVWLVIGMIIYLTYGRKNSRVQQHLLSRKAAD
jgi:APA family basic amino acid/polyamine antiporter